MVKALIVREGKAARHRYQAEVLASKFAIQRDLNCFARHVVRLRSKHVPESPIGDQPSEEREQCAYNNVIPGQHAQSVRMCMWHK